MSISDALINLQSKLRSLGIQNAPDGVPESANAFPFGVSYLSNGSMDLASAGWSKHFHTIYTEIHISRQLLPAAITKAMSYLEPFLASLMGDPTLGDTVATVVDVRYKFGKLSWGNIETIGERFEIDVKILYP